MSEQSILNPNYSDVESVKLLNSKYKDLRSEISKVIVGQDKIINQLMISILAKGHCLLVGVPGLAKTLIVKTLSEVLDLKFSRIQFTPDLMPSDITGTEILENDREGNKIFKFIKGPVFGNIILADEINRTPPKTQSALLESMQEYRVTSAGNTYDLEEPFFVLATQNPIEQEGTYPLPEAQLDRFMFNLWLEYPEFNDELEIIKRTTSLYKPELKIIFSKNDIHLFQDLVRKVPVADEVINYAVSLVSRTRPMNPDSPKVVKDYLSWGAGPRASQYLILGAKTNCILEGRYSPNIDDVKKVAHPVLRHRLIPNFNAEADGMGILKIIDSLIEN
ncbi:MAG TPA: MoxR family ATPase [Ignavibacteria bacterium]|nr:MoxR family ATPase [Ignavibacteria bacterium]HMR41845.1 MoxR family ATPase [Ignavibacteria bacterium]